MGATDGNKIVRYFEIQYMNVISPEEVRGTFEQSFAFELEELIPNGRLEPKCKPKCRRRTSAACHDQEIGQIRRASIDSDEDADNCSRRFILLDPDILHTVLRC